MVTLLNTIVGEKGELFMLSHGRHVLFAHCKPEISIYEKNTQVSVLGGPGYRKKAMRFTAALCGDIEFTLSAGEEVLKKVERYELTADILRNDGVVERFYFHNISLLEINQDGRWEFDLKVTEDQYKKLLTMAGA